MLKRRIMRAVIAVPGQEVVLDETLDIKFVIRKAALALQNRATITVFGMSQPLREQLLSQFTAWNKRMTDSGNLAENLVNVSLVAGYEDDQGIEVSAVVFEGQIVLVNLISPPPDIGIEIQCFTNQVDKTKFVSSQPPSNTTFKEYVLWAANQMGIQQDSVICETSFNDSKITNPSTGALNVASLLIDIQNSRRPDVAAFIDDGVLIVKDRDKVINPSNIAFINEFVGMPNWTEWGVEYTCIFDTAIRLAHGVQLESKFNPSLNGKYVNVSLEYELSSRENPFYVTAQATQPSE